MSTPQGTPLENHYEDQRVSMLLDWAYDFGLIEWVVGEDGEVSFIRACCADH